MTDGTSADVAFKQTDRRMRQVLKTYGYPPNNDLIAELIAASNPYVKQRELELSKAYGGCTNCYGKGYATANGRWRGTDTDTDIGGNGKTYSGGNPNEMKFCECGRGKQLERVIKQRELALLERLERKSIRYTPDGLVADGLDPWAVSVSAIQKEKEAL